MNKKAIALTLSLLSWPLLASPNSAVLQNSDAQNLVDNANQINSSNSSGASSFVDQFRSNEQSSSDIQLDPNMVKEAQALISTSQSRINAVDVQQKAKAFVTDSEKFVGQQTFSASNSDKPLVNGINIGDLIAQYKNPYQEKENPTEGKELPTLMVFISSSMPEQALRDLAIQTKKADGIMVINGFVGGKLSSTIEFLKPYIEETEVMINIDPTMFELFKVTSVPEIIVTTEPLTPCTPDKGGCEYVVPKHDRIKGNVTLYYALEQFSWDGVTSTTSLDHLGKLQAGQWNNAYEQK